MRIKINKDGTIRGQQPKLPEIGKIRTGKKIKRNGKEYPTSLDHFIATGNFASGFHRACGEQPKSLPICFFSDDTNDSVSSFLAAYDNQGKTFVEGDGEYWRYYDSESDSYKEGELTIDQVKKAVAKKGLELKEVLRMKFVIVDVLLPCEIGAIGYWTLYSSGAASSIPNITEVFDTIQQMNGTVMGVVFDLEVKKVTSRKPGSKSRYPVISLIPRKDTEHSHKELITGTNDQPKQLTGTTDIEVVG
jgi:hypothetical protein